MPTDGDRRTARDGCATAGAAHTLRAALLLATLLLGALRPLPATASDGALPLPQCPARPGDVVFLPCGEVFAFQPRPGVAITPFAGTPPPSDGPLLDLTAGNRALRSSGGRLDAELRLVTGMPDNPMRVGSKPYRVASFQGQNRLGGVVSSFNGVFPAPTLMLRPGDTMRLTIHDQRIPDEVVQASPLHFDPTDPVPQAANLHTHGLLVSPTGEGDNVYRAFLPGNRYRTEVHLGDDHPEGMDWYHPHMHGSTAGQVFGGMAGLIQVGGVVAPRHRGLVEGLVTRQLVLSGLALAPSPDDPELFLLGPVTNATSPTLTDPNPAAAIGAPRTAPDYRPSHLVNGQLNPTIAMRPNETQVWTAANFNASSSYSLAILRLGSDGRVDPAAPLFRTTQLGQDGNDHYVPVRGHLVRHRDPMSDFHVTPGERLTWSVTAPPEPGTYYLVNAVDYAYTRQVGNLPAVLTFQPPQAFVPSLILATVEVAGVPAVRRVPEFPPTETPDIVGADPALTREIAFDFDEQYLRGRVNFGYFPDTAVIQGYSGDAETWVVSTYSQVAHPIHIHQGDFIVEQIAYYEDQALTTLRRDLPENPVVYPFRRTMDTLALPGRSKVQLRLRASAFPGKFVMHCHMLLHEDSGMMASIAVSRPRDQELTAIGAGRGSAPLVSLVKAATGEAVIGFHAFDRGYRGGVSAAVGHPLGGFAAYAAVAPLQGLPMVRIVDPRDPAAPILEIRPFGGAGDGATVALGDIDGDAVDEVIVGSGPGTTPSVAVYDIVATPDGGRTARLRLEVPVFDAAYRTGGVRVAAADVDGDNWDDIVIANGPGVRNRIAVLSGQILSEAASGDGALVAPAGNPALGRDLRLSVCSATGQSTVLADQFEPLAGSDGLNLAAGMLGGGFATYPPLTRVGFNPVVAEPYRAQIAVTRSAAREDAEVGIFEYTGPSAHEHGEVAGDPASYLRPIGLFTPFPGARAPDDGLTLSTGLTAVADPNTPITGLVAALDPSRQTVSYFDIGGAIVTRPWAQRRAAGTRQP